MLLPNMAYAANTPSVLDGLNSSRSETYVAKKNVYSNDLLDVCYYPAEKTFYAVGKNGTLLVSVDGGTNWGYRSDLPDFNSGASIDFIDLDCSSSKIVIIGNGHSDGKVYAYMMSGTSTFFTKVELNNVLNVSSLKAGGVSIYESGPTFRLVIVEENSSNYIYYDGMQWGRASLNGASTGATAVTVDQNSGTFYTYNNNASSIMQFYIAYNNLGGQWTQSHIPSYALSKATNVYKNSKEHLVLMQSSTESHKFTVQVSGGSRDRRNFNYFAEAAYLDPARNVTIFAGWKDDQMVIRSSFDPNNNSYADSHLVTLTGALAENAIVGRGKLYGIAAGLHPLQDNQWVYIAVGTDGTILRSTNGYEFSPVAQQLDYDADIAFAAISVIPNGGNQKMAALTSDNRLYYSEDLGQTWKQVARFPAVQGEIKDMLFAGQKLYVIENVPSTETTTGKVNIHLVESAKKVSTAIINDFVVNGISSNNYGLIYMGKMLSVANRGKMVTYDFSGQLVQNTYDPGSYGPPTLQLHVKIGTQDYFMGDSSIYYATYYDGGHNNSGLRYKYGVANGRGIGAKFKHFVQLGDRYLFVSDEGDVRIGHNVITVENYFADSEFYTGKIADTDGLSLVSMDKVDGLLMALDADGSVYTSFNGIEWKYQSSLSDGEHNRFGHNGASIVFAQDGNKVVLMSVPYDATTSGTVTDYPVATVVPPQPPGPYDIGEQGTNMITVTPSNQGSYEVSYRWYVMTDGHLVAIPGKDGSQLDLSVLDTGRQSVYVKVTYRDRNKVDQPESSRLFGPYNYDMIHKIYDVDIDLSAEFFDVLADYNASEMDPITVTITNIGNQTLNGLQMAVTAASTQAIEAVPRDTNKSLSDLGPLAPEQSVMVDLYIKPGMASNVYETEIRVESANMQNAKYAQVPVYVERLQASLDRSQLDVAYDHAVDDAKVALTLQNLSSEILGISNISLTDQTNFQLSNVPAELAGITSHTFYVTPKAPLQPGETYEYDIRILYSAGMITRHVSIAVEDAPNYELTIVPVKTSATIMDNYSDPAVGQLSFKIRNTGNRPISDLAVTLEGDDANLFTLNTIPADIAVGDEVTVIAEPQANLAADVYEAAARVTANSGIINLTQNLALTVSDVPVYSQKLSLDKYELVLEYGNTQEDRTIELTVLNDGNQPLEPNFSYDQSLVRVDDAWQIPALVNIGDSANVTFVVKDEAAVGTHNSSFIVSGGQLYDEAEFTLVIEPHRLSLSADRMSAALLEGYANANDGKFAVTIANTSSRTDLSGLAASLSDNTNFRIASGISNNALDAGMSGEYEIVPIDGLAPGRYEVVFAIQADQAVPQSVTLTLEVEQLVHSLDLSANRTSAALTQGYSNPETGKFVLTLANDGNVDLGNVQISLSDDTKFTATALASNTLAAGASRTVDIVPVSGLAAGDHTVTVTAAADQVAPQTVTLILTVNPLASGAWQ